MYKSIVLEGGDGVGKSTLATEITRHINEKSSTYEAAEMGFPSSAIGGFRAFFLAQQGNRPSIDDGKIIWKPNYHTGVPPMANLLMVLGDFIYVHSFLSGAPDIKTIEKRGKIPLIIFDRGILSTIVYQVLYPFQVNGVNRLITKSMQVEMMHIIEQVLSLPDMAIPPHDKLVFLGSPDNEVRMTGDDTFDNFDQTRVNYCFSKTYSWLQGEAVSDMRLFEDEGMLPWLQSWYRTSQFIEAFSKPSEELALDIAADYI